MEKARRRTMVSVSVFGTFLAVLVLGIYLPAGGDGRSQKEFMVSTGDGSSKVARLLAEEGLARSRYLFLFYLVFTGQEKDLKAGRYLLPSGGSIPEIARILTRGWAESDDVEITIPEGFNVWEIDRELARRGLMEAGEFFQRARHLEGELFPDTYRLRHDQSLITNHQSLIGNSRAEEIIQKMEDNFRTKTAEWFKGATAEEVKKMVIIASLLEKEVESEGDRRLVAGIIEKRLKLGMFLQIDASVAYGACRGEFESLKFKEGEAPPEFKSCDVAQVNLVKSIEIDGPYNTYTRPGLPAGPISNPGLGAMKAARYPQDSDYLFYLSARDGRTIFSKTAEEHSRNRTKFLR